MISKTVEKLKDPEYRAAFVGSQINIGIPFQIRALLKSRNWTQQILADKTEMLQPRISGLLSPGRTRPNIETLRRIAQAFDCGLLVKFVPFSELAKWSDDFDPEAFSVPAFDEDPGFIEKKPIASATISAASLLVNGTHLGAIPSARVLRMPVQANRMPTTTQVQAGVQNASVASENFSANQPIGS